MSNVEQILVHVTALRRYARLLTSDGHRADDLVQDTLERAASRWAMWQPGTALRSWLFTLMHNIHANQRRDGRIDDAALPLDAVPETGQETSSRIGDRLDLQRALAELSDEQRAVLLLVSVEEYTYAEAAQLLDIPIGTVMSRLHRARERLRTRLEAHAEPRPALLLVKR